MPDPNPLLANGIIELETSDDDTGPDHPGASASSAARRPSERVGAELHRRRAP